MADKPILLFSTPRSSSTFLHKHILQELDQTVSLGEYFNILGSWTIKDSNNGIIRVNARGRFDGLTSESLLKAKYEERMERLELLKKYNETGYFFKVFPSHMTDEIFDYLNENYRFICLMRNNKFSQIVSWGQLKTQRETEKIFKREYFDFITQNIDDYEHLLTQLRDPMAYVVLEDNVKGRSPDQLLSDIFDGKLTTNNFKYSEEMTDPRISMFKNSDEVVEWYNTWIQKYY